MRSIKLANASVLCMAAGLFIDLAIAAENTSTMLFRNALLGHCYTAITGETLVKTEIDVATWPRVVWAEASDRGSLTENARAKDKVIVDQTQKACHVQVGGVDSAALAVDLRNELQKPPFSAVILEEKMGETPRSGVRKRTIVFGILSETSDAIPVIVLNEFLPPAPGIVTAEIGLGSKAKKPEFQPYPTPRITESQWKTYYDQVKAAYGGSMQEFAGQRLVAFNGDTVAYAFTMPGHPAHPAWIARRPVRNDQGNTTIQQIGHFAGQEAPFAELFRQYQELTNRTIKPLEAPRR
jgi:hypothetical protein